MKLRQAMGVQCVATESKTHDEKGPLFDAECVQEIIGRILSEEIVG